MDEPKVLPTAARATGCPYAPAAELYEMQKSEELPRIRIPNPMIGEFEAVALTRYSDIRSALNDDRLQMGFVFDPDAPRTMLNQPGNLLNYNGAEHSRLRRMLTAAFTVKRIRALQPMVEEVVAERLDALAAEGPGVDLVTEFSTPIPTQVICHLLGVPYADRADFQRRAKVGLDINTSREKQIENLAELDAYMAELVAAHRREPGDNMLGILVRDHGPELTDDELVGIGNMLLIAGHETTASMLSAGTALLLQHPEQLAVVRDDPSAIDGAIEELLRFCSPATTMPRQAAADLQVRDQVIKKGERVMTSILVANRDPDIEAPDLDTLDVRRPPQPHITFGYGAHQCLGQQLARLELRVALPALFNRFPTLAVGVDHDEIDYRTTALVFGVNRLPVTW
ncbi:cytochrome P450 [Actinoalloteichus hymeniacidonis]|uniref:Cytochrome P450 n=1 Tax=Actinoalloteichus hymeniacidonis TaxID=340345 RepID=A0AAC9MYM0_9PSEU|nr:cytochrome P450 [Actinoalloteichus hymeniacidonis]AOS64498.1 cytochrome P450 [Actinoalloteichus hymeniacidonis]MBB5907431.1 cytochrome P450 [Actinoalloteichus hymeniacidonis]